MRLQVTGAITDLEDVVAHKERHGSLNPPVPAAQGDNACYNIVTPCELVIEVMEKEPQEARQ